MTFHLTCVHIILVRFVLLSGHLFGNSCSLGWPCVLIVFCLFVILVISRFGLEGRIWVLIASVPGLCILFTFKHSIPITEISKTKIKTNVLSDLAHVPSSSLYCMSDS